MTSSLACLSPSRPPVPRTRADAAVSAAAGPRVRNAQSAWPTSAGLIVGVLLDRLVPDPRRGHPVALFGTAAARLERAVYAPSRARGALFTAVAAGSAVALGAALERAVGSIGRSGSGGRSGPGGVVRSIGRVGPAGSVGSRGAAAPAGSAAPAGPVGSAGSAGPGEPTESAGPVGAGRRVTAVATAGVTAGAAWAALGGAMLAREAEGIADALEAGDLEEARRRLPGLCGRDPSGLDEKGIARAAVESVAENTSDAVVAPLVWGGLLGLPGLLGYRAANTLDAMVGHRTERYERFGAASARLDDLANWAPARLTALLACACAPAVGGDPRRALRVAARYGHLHPSPNSGRCEAAFAGALDLRLGGANRYGDHVEHRPELGEGRHPEPADIRRAAALARAVDTGAAAVAAAVAALPGGRP